METIDQRAQKFQKNVEHLKELMSNMVECVEKLSIPEPVISANDKEIEIKNTPEEHKLDSEICDELKNQLDTNWHFRKNYFHELVNIKISCQMNDTFEHMESRKKIEEITHSILRYKSFSIFFLSESGGEAKLKQFSSISNTFSETPASADDVKIFDQMDEKINENEFIEFKQEDYEEEISFINFYLYKRNIIHKFTPVNDSCYFVYHLPSETEGDLVTQSLSNPNLKFFVEKVTAFMLKSCSLILNTISEDINANDMDELIHGYVGIIDDVFLSHAVKTIEELLQIECVGFSDVDNAQESIQSLSPEQIPFTYKRISYTLVLLRKIEDPDVVETIGILNKKLEKIARFAKRAINQMSNQQLYNLLNDRITFSFDKNFKLNFCSDKPQDIIMKYVSRNAVNSTIKFPDSFHKSELRQIIEEKLEDITKMGILTYSHQRPNFIIITHKDELDKLLGFTLSLFLDNSQKMHSTLARKDSMPLSRQSKQRDTQELMEIFSYTTNHDEMKNLRQKSRFQTTIRSKLKALSVMKNSKDGIGSATTMPPLVIEKRLSISSKQAVSEMTEFSLEEITNSKINDFIPDEISEAPALQGFLRSNSKKMTLASRTQFKNLDNEEVQFNMYIEDKKKHFTRRFEHLKTRPDASSMTREEEDSFMINEWTVDSYEIEGKELVRKVFVLFSHFNFFERYSISIDNYLKFIWDLKWYYEKFNNPFHNFSHGFAVCHACFYIVKTTALDKLFSDAQKFALILSGLCHDVGHTGRNNTFEANSLSKLSLRYHDRSILEQHHAALTFKIMRKSDDYNIMKNMAQDQQISIRKLIITNILSTDMKEHFELIGLFKNEMSTKGTSFSENEEDKVLISRIAIHCADLCGPSKKQDIAEKWSRLVNNEFMAQAAEEKSLGLNVTPYYLNLDKNEVFYKSEATFIKAIVYPLWEIFGIFCEGEIDNILEQLKANKQRYEEEMIQYSLPQAT